MAMGDKLNGTQPEEMRYSAPAFLVAAAKMNDLIWKQPIVDTGSPHATRLCAKVGASL
jgi:hypothetical protein